ncbi:MAG: GDP-mannose 4,6-dehydratase [Bacteroidia bacterium]|nr:GDP-mannose 4,6-dehydratase [Bacteroidia bacterium]
MRILITGVAGFIGSNLAGKLLEAGYEVIGVDNFSFGFERNISRFRKLNKFTFIEGDIRDSNCLKNHKSDVIVHLASQKIPRYTNAFRTLDDNNNTLQKIVQKCISDKSRIIYASTSDVYGKNTKLPFSETSDLVLGPTTIKRWAYAISKIYGEQYIIASHEEFGLDYTIGRFFGAYGPNQNPTWWGGPQSVFINKALQKEEMEIHGDGSQTRTFTYVEDTVNAVTRFISDPKSDNQIFNVGATQECEISIIDLARLIWKQINGDKLNPRLKFIPYSDFGKYEDVMARIPDISKLKEFFNFEPAWSLEEGLKKTIAWQREIK